MIRTPALCYQIGIVVWATTDHTGISKMPSLGFVDTLKYSVTLLLISLAGILVSGIRHAAQSRQDAGTDQRPA